VLVCFSVNTLAAVELKKNSAQSKNCALFFWVAAGAFSSPAASSFI
jgi:hypothetical protein